MNFRRIKFRAISGWMTAAAVTSAYAIKAHDGWSVVLIAACIFVAIQTVFVEPEQ